MIATIICATYRRDTSTERSGNRNARVPHFPVCPCTHIHTHSITLQRTGASLDMGARRAPGCEQQLPEQTAAQDEVDLPARSCPIAPRQILSHCPLKSVEFPRLRLCCYVTVCLCVPVRQVSALLSLLSSLYIFDTKHTTRRRAPEGNSRADGPRRIDGTAGEGALKRVTQSTVVGASSSAAATITQQPCLPARKHDRASSHAPLHSDWRSQCQQSFVI